MKKATITSLDQLPSKYKYLVSYNPREWPKFPEKMPSQVAAFSSNLEILMYSPVSGGYNHDFAPLEHFNKYGADHDPKIPKKNVVLPLGEKPPSSDIEATINCQSENSISQNRILSNTNSTVKNILHTQNKMLSGVKNEKKVEQVIGKSSQHAGLIKALDHRLVRLQYANYLPSTSLFHLFQKMMVSLK